MSGGAATEPQQPFDHRLVDPFDLPSVWRALAAVELGLDHDEVISVAVGAAYPSALRTLLTSLPPRLTTLVDLGAGVGATSEHLRRATGATVVAVEPASGARRAARWLFPELIVVEGTAQRTPLTASWADAVTLCGVVSLLDDLDAVLIEVRRLLRDGGTVALTDLVSSTSGDVVSGPNVFRSIEHLIVGLERHGLDAAEIGCGPATARGPDAQVARRVDAWIDEHFAWHPAHADWRADDEHVAGHVAAGDVLGCCIVARC